MSRFLLNRRGKILALFVILAAILISRWLLPVSFPLKPRPEMISLSKETQAVITSAVSPSSINSKANENCQKLGILPPPKQSISLTELEQHFAHLGDHQEEEHWTNFIVRSASEVVIWHLVRTEGQEGAERWDVKSFREDADGPTLLTEKSFAKKNLALAYLRKHLPASHEQEKIFSWFYPKNVSIKIHTTPQGNQFTLSLPQGELSCDQNTCDCKVY